METSFGVNLCFSIKIIFDRVKRSFSTSSRRCRRQKKSSYFIRLIDCYFHLPFCILVGRGTFTVFFSIDTDFFTVLVLFYRY